MASEQAKAETAPLADEPVENGQDRWRRSRMGRAFDLRSYDRNFRLFLLVSSTGMVLQSAITTLTVELTAALPFISSARQIGDIVAAGRIAMAVASLCWAMAARRGALKRLLLLGQGLATGGFLLGVLAPNHALLAVGLLLSYVGAGAMVALGPVAALAMAPAGKRGQALSVMAMASLLGAAMGTVVPSFVVGRLAWPGPVLIPAVYSLLGAWAAAALRLPSGGAARATSAMDELAGWGRMLRVRSNATLLLYLAVLQFASGGAGYYLFTVLKQDYALSARAAMGVVMGAQALILVGTGFWGSAADDAVRQRANGRVRVLLLMTLIATVSQVLAYAALPLYRLNPWLLGVYMAFSLLASASGLMAITPVVFSIVGDTTPPELRPLAVSLRNLVGFVAGGLGIAATGALQGALGGYTTAMLLSSAVGPLAVLVLLPALRQVPEEMARE